MIPTWLQQLLDARGSWNDDGVSRRARAGHCRHCGRVVLRGLDADRAALPVTADPEPLNALGEFLALSTGLTTYDLQWQGRYELNLRESTHIQATPPRPHDKTSVVAQHSCQRITPIEGRHFTEEKQTDGERCPY